MTTRGLMTLRIVTQNCGNGNVEYGSVANNDECSYAKSHFDNCSYAKCPCGELHFAECRGTITT